ncbi:MAG TPA: alkaline phosphatase family protein [Terracidiphilus sp.]|nr:alkaline phosphatase family protein [Terracidiphilus sp.]
MPSKALFLFACLSIAGLAGAQSIPRSSHVWIINEENHSYNEVVGNSQMPYYNQLISQYALADQFYSDQHSSLPALMWFVAGAPVEPNNDTTSCGHSDDNVVRELLKQGYSWRSYQEDLPYAGFQGLYSPDYLYYRRHNPLIDFTDVCPGTGQDTNVVPFTQMASDFSQIGTVNFAWITPDVNDDAHNGTLEAADQWLQANVPAILARPEFAPGGDGILFIVWDEADFDNNSCSAAVDDGCGGRTATLVIGPQVVPGYRSSLTYHNENVLATVCAAMGLSTCPGAAQGAAPMADFFYPSPAAAASPQNSIRIATPGNGATVVGAVNLIASASESLTVSQTQVWDNGVKLGVYGTQINATYNLSPGPHTTTVLDLDSNYSIIHASSVTYNVVAPVPGLQILSPTPNETVTTLPVEIAAQANESVDVGQIQVWDNGVKLGYYGSANVNQYYALAPGPHTTTLVDLDFNGNVLHESSVAYNVAAPASGVQIISPTPAEPFSNSTIQVIAQATEAAPVSQMQVWDNGVKLGWSLGSEVNQEFSVAPGTHTVTVLGLDSNYNVLDGSSVAYTVPGPTNGVEIVTPYPAQSIGSATVQVSAQATEAVPVSQMQVWDNGVKLGWYPGTTVNQNFTLPPGPHILTILDLDSNYNIIHLSSVSYSMQ